MRLEQGAGPGLQDFELELCKQLKGYYTQGQDIVRLAFLWDDLGWMGGTPKQRQGESGNCFSGLGRTCQ